MGSHYRCWCFDIHILYDKNEKEIDHLNIHQTVKIDSFPNTKATFSSSYLILSIPGSVFIILTSYLSSFLNSMLGLVSCFRFILDLMSGSFFGLTSGLSFSPSRLIFKLVPILKLGDDTNILLL